MFSANNNVYGCRIMQQVGRGRVVRVSQTLSPHPSEEDYRLHAIVRKANLAKPGADAAFKSE